jgi:hypothetical protein
MRTVLHEKADDIAKTHPFFEREREITGSSFVRGLVFGWMQNPQASLDDLSQSIGNAGTPVTRQAVHQRLNAKGADYLHEVLQVGLKQTVQGMQVSQGLLSRFQGVYVLDSTQLELPVELAEQWSGCGGTQGESAAMKVHVRWEMRSGELQRLELSDGRQHDGNSQVQQTSLPTGSLRIADLGYFSLNVLEKTSKDGSYWITRYKTGTHLYDETGAAIPLLKYLPSAVGEQIDRSVWVGQKARLPARLVAQRVPLKVVKQRHKRLEREAQDKGQSVSARAYELAHWTIYLTNVPLNQLSVPEVLILGRYRWQIELLFKLWKSELHIDTWNTTKPARILCELYAKLIAVLVTHWLLLVGTWHNSQRSLARSMNTIRGLAWQFANSLLHHDLLQHVFQALKRSLRACRVERTSTFTPACFLVDAA